MSPLVTILLYVVIPVVAIVVISVLTLIRPSGRGARYRSGGSWDHEPMWWMGNPRGSGVPEPGEPADPSDDPTLQTARGGARGTW